MTVRIEAHYLPCIAYFTAIASADEIVLERQENFAKQTYRSRCHILAANGPIQLIVPVTAKQGKVNIADVRLDYSQKWVNNHWRTIQSAYGKAPFFEHYADDLRGALFQKVEFLYELNYMLLSICLKWLGWNLSIKESEKYDLPGHKDELDLRSAINAKNKELCYQFYYPVKYNQVFGSTFVDNMSLIDLIFCEGPSASKIVKDSVVQK